jgi:nitrogen-specific signal transduction histidine kinase
MRKFLSMTNDSAEGPKTGHIPAPIAAHWSIQRPKLTWMDLLWLLFLAGIAALPPVSEIHKQAILLAMGILQISEGWLIARLPERGRYYVVILKILLATILLDHTGELGINSSYYPIFYLPVVTAAMYFGPWGMLFWTLVSSAAYCSFLYPALQEYALAPSGIAELTIRNLFFFLAGIIVNRFATENRRTTLRYQMLAEQLAETNRRLERAEAEARRSERLAALGRLSAGLAHEIRNPLGVIKGSAEMLSRKLKSSDPLAAELSGYISSEVNRLSSLISRFLDFARPLQLERRARALPEILDRAIRIVDAGWQGPPVTIKRDFQSTAPPVSLDEDFAEQVFVNLIQNAYEAMSDQGGGMLSISTTSAARNGAPGVEVQIADSGPGIPAYLRDQIFNPFVTTKKTGVGLGLSIVAKIVDEHRGSIQLTGGDRGASFSVFFPVDGETGTPAPAPPV